MASSSILLNSAPGAPLRLYFQVAPGRVADLEVISRTSLAFASGIREIAFLLDPAMQLQIGIQGHADGSLWQDNLLNSGRDFFDKPENRKQMYLLAIAGLGWIMQPPFERVREQRWKPYLERYLPDAPPAARAEDLDRVSRVLEKDVAGGERRQFFREAERDTAIEGLAASIERTKPPLVIPRADFATNSGRVATEVAAMERATVGPIRVTLISPVLEVGPRRWKFATAQGEFGASVRDREFLEAIAAGRTTVRMRSGIQLDIQLETRERLVDGVWTITERNVIKVDSLDEPAASRQGTFLSEHGEAK